MGNAEPPAKTGAHTGHLEGAWRYSGDIQVEGDYLRGPSPCRRCYCTRSPPSAETSECKHNVLQCNGARGDLPSSTSTKQELSECHLVSLGICFRQSKQVGPEMIEQDLNGR